MAEAGRRVSAVASGGSLAFRTLMQLDSLRKHTDLQYHQNLPPRRTGLGRPRGRHRALTLLVAVPGGDVSQLAGAGSHGPGAGRVRAAAPVSAG